METIIGKEGSERSLTLSEQLNLYKVTHAIAEIIHIPKTTEELETLKESLKQQGFVEYDNPKAQEEEILDTSVATAEKESVEHQNSKGDFFDSSAVTVTAVKNNVRLVNKLNPVALVNQSHADNDKNKNAESRIIFYTELNGTTTTLLYVKDAKLVENIV